MATTKSTRIKIPIQQYWVLLKVYFRPQWPMVLLLALLLLMSIGLQLLNPQILRHFIDLAVASSKGNEQALKDVAKSSYSISTELLISALLFTGAAVLNQFLALLAQYVGENIGWKATNELRGDLAEHCLRLDLSFHKEHTSGEMVERIDGDVNSLSNFFSSFVIALMSNMVLLIGVLIVLFQVDWRIGLGMTLFVIFALLIMKQIRTIAAPFWVKVSIARAEFYGFIGEHLAGTEDTRSNGAVSHVMRRFYELLRNWLPISRKAGLAGYSMWMSSVFVFALGNAMIIILGGYLWSKGSITIGTLYMIFYYTELLNRPIENIRTQLEDLQRADSSIIRTQELFQTVSKIKEAGATQSVSALVQLNSRSALSVDFHNVTFGYTVNEPVLEQISFHLQGGKVLGLLGRTGSGKSTLARLLLRFYDPNSGSISLGDVPIHTPSLRELRKKVGIVTQDVQLFHASVRDNVTLYDPEIQDARIIEVLDDLGLTSWFNSLPDGLETKLAAGGGGLSAGEAQLLAFTRVFLNDPGLIILDEASSRLDPATEQLIERAVKKLLQGRTAIIIAHHLTTIQRADHILILDQCKVLEYGERIHLINDPSSRFNRLLHTGIEEVMI
jgi:ATP-binding cassette, subfamily B, bacterial